MEAWYNKGVHFVKFDQYPMTPQIHPLPDSYKDWYLKRLVLYVKMYTACTKTKPPR